MYTGLTGKVKIGESAAASVAYISNWSVEDKVELLEVPVLGQRTKDKIAGMRGWTASADGAVEFETVNGIVSGQKELFTAMHDGTPVACKFCLNDNVYFSGKGLIESISVDLSAEDKGNISISISGTDELKYTASGI